MLRNEASNRHRVNRLCIGANRSFAIAQDDKEKILPIFMLRHEASIRDEANRLYRWLLDPSFLRMTKRRQILSLPQASRLVAHLQGDHYALHMSIRNSAV
jgi:hypothetical protein